MSSLAELEQRIAALEDLSAGEAGSANYLTIVNGLVGANFSGQINAAGIIFPAGTSFVSQIQWIRQSDGAVIASIFGNEISGVDPNLTLEAIMQSGDTQAEASLIASTNPNVGSVQIQAQAFPLPVGPPLDNANVLINTKSGGQVRQTLAREDGASSYMQAASGISVSRAGDPMTVYISTASAAVTSGVDFNYIAGVGVAISTGTDPGGRWNGTGYVCRNTGIYEASGGISYPASSVIQVQVGASNNNTGYKIKAPTVTANALSVAGHSFGGIFIPASAGDLIIPVAQLSSSVSVGNPAGTSPGTWFSCKQVQ